MTERIQKPSKQESQRRQENDHLLMLYNDEIHSFDYVIESLIEVCNHSSVQAEQCTTIAHYKGACDVKKGSAEELKEMQLALIQKGLKADIK